MSTRFVSREPALRWLLALIVAAGVAACGSEAAPDVATEADAEAPRELAPGIVRPDIRFEVAPPVGERFPDVEVHDDQGNPVRILEIAARKPHTVLTLGCLT